ncbi:MAG: crossover junction endodeoxyribonuclease RuvC [Desulfobacterales bacterium]|jgi:crossover junction endodeoxyribonuclease RuvC|nr:crossover junction endodeoxyribonuclease RuvC [Desulfobacterales bacterium]
MVKIIGIDPGLAATGIGIISGRGLHVERYAYGSISTASGHATAKRLHHIFSKLIAIIKNESPDMMIVEDIFSLGKYPKSGIMLGKVTGVVLLAASQAAIPVHEVAVREIKQVLTGNGNAGKEQLEAAVRHALNCQTPIRPFHASDALAIALIGLYRYQAID